MPSNKDAAVVHAIGIDTGKNTLHMIGLDEKGTIVLREKVSRGPRYHTTCERAAMPDRDRGRHGHALHGP